MPSPNNYCRKNAHAHTLCDFTFLYTFIYRPVNELNLSDELQRLPRSITDHVTGFSVVHGISELAVISDEVKWAVSQCSCVSIAVYALDGFAPLSLSYKCPCLERHCVHAEWII